MSNVVIDEIVESLSKLTLIEAAQLVKKLEETWGVSATAPVAVAGTASDNGANAGSEKSAFTIVLKAVGGKKIDVIKIVREATGLGLAEAKALVDGAPKDIKENVEKGAAEEIKKKLEAVGATVELK